QGSRSDGSPPMKTIAQGTGSKSEREKKQARHHKLILYQSRLCKSASSSIIKYPTSKPHDYASRCGPMNGKSLTVRRSSVLLRRSCYFLKMPPCAQGMLLQLADEVEHDNQI